MQKIILCLITFVMVTLFSCCKKNSPCVTCPPTGEDTTSHAVNWFVDTLGTQGVIRDVWVFDRNNAWAVGEIYLNDSTGKPNMANPYNAARWDGSKWELKRISFVGPCSAVLNPPIQAIWAFATNNMLVTNGGSIVIYDGVNANMDCRMNSLLTGAINKIYAVNSQNVYAVGNSGTIIHYNGTSWTKMASNTTVDFQDIWGIDATHIWATGTNVGDGHSVVLQCNGTSWTTIYDNANKPPNEVQAFSTVWGNTSDKIYLAGQSWIRSMNLNDGSFKLLDNLAKWVAMRIRGTKQNDIFQVDYGNEAMHFNGMSWYHYPELASLDEGTRLYSVHPTNDFVLLGGTIFIGLNGFPVVVRGYR